MPTGHILSEGDVRRLQEMSEFVRAHALPEPGRRTLDTSDPSPSQTCIARTPVGGIPALTVVTAPELRLRERDSVQVYVSSEDEPGRAYCDIYRITITDDVKHQLRPIPLLSQMVYNLSGEAIPENKWILVSREKFGAWIAIAAVGGSVGDAGFWGWLNSVDCPNGRFEVYELVPTEGGAWDFIWDGTGVYSDQVYHVDRYYSFPYGGPLIAPGTVRWIRPGKFNEMLGLQEYLFEGPAGMTGRFEVMTNWQCNQSTGLGEKTTKFIDVFNGDIVRVPCVEEPPLSPCDPCS